MSQPARPGCRVSANRPLARPCVPVTTQSQVLSKRWRRGPRAHTWWAVCREQPSTHPTCTAPDECLRNYRISEEKQSQIVAVTHFIMTLSRSEHQSIICGHSGIHSCDRLLTWDTGSEQPGHLTPHPSPWLSHSCTGPTGVQYPNLRT